MFEVLNLTGRAITGEDDLFMALMQGIEGMEEFLLNALFACKELDIVDQQHIRLAILFAKPNQLIVLDGIDVFVRKLFRRNVGDSCAFLVSGDVLTDGVKQVSFAKSDTAVKKQGVVRLAGRLRDSERGG